MQTYQLTEARLGRGTNNMLDDVLHFLKFQAGIIS